MPKPPILEHIVRQHAEMAAFLWTVFDHHLLHFLLDNIIHVLMLKKKNIY